VKEKTLEMREGMTTSMRCYVMGRRLNVIKMRAKERNSI
jgi:hypothetical protein